MNKELRRLVANRADYLCEYCLIHEQDTVLGCTIDHIISIKHGGSSEVTARILGFNDQNRLLECQILISKKRYRIPV